MSFTLAIFDRKGTKFAEVSIDSTSTVRDLKKEIIKFKKI